MKRQLNIFTTKVQSQALLFLLWSTLLDLSFRMKWCILMNGIWINKNIFWWWPRDCRPKVLEDLIKMYIFYSATSSFRYSTNYRTSHFKLSDVFYWIEHELFPDVSTVLHVLYVLLVTYNLFSSLTTFKWNGELFQDHIVYFVCWWILLLN